MGVSYSEGKFNYKKIDDLRKDIEEKELTLKLSENTDLYKREVVVGDRKIPNSIATLPMEGGDATEMGIPTELTYRKYKNIAKGGAGLIWIEAVSVCDEGRSNDKQLWIREDNYLEFKKLNEMIKEEARKEFGEDHQPLTVIQLNHSGRYCKRDGKSTPIIASHKKLLDDRLGIGEDYRVVSDEYLIELEDKYLEAARLSKLAGFDAVDIKACHGYLLSEILSAYEREGQYGGSFENRTRLMLNIVDKIREDDQCQGLMLATRMNIYDGIPYPQGWGVSKEDHRDYDLEEPKRLISELVKRDVNLISLTMGNPYFIPHINKPYDIGNYVPEEEVIKSCERLIEGIGEIQKEFPQAAIVGVGYSWFRDLASYVGAGSLENGLCSLIGFGRESIAYPDFARDLMEEGRLDKRKVCISCSKCSELKANIGTCGCVVRDSEIYLPMYKEMIEERV